MDMVRKYAVHAFAVFGLLCVAGLILAKVRGASSSDAAA